MGRFYETSQPHFIDNKMYEAPAELMAKVLMNKEKAVDDTIDSAKLYLEKLKAEALVQDTPRLQEKIKAYEDKITGIVTNIQANPMEYTKYQGDITQLGRDISADWTTGAIGTMQTNKKKAEAEVAKLDEHLKLHPEDAEYVGLKKKEIFSNYSEGAKWNDKTGKAEGTLNVDGTYYHPEFDDKFIALAKAKGKTVERDTVSGAWINTSSTDSKILTQKDLQEMYIAGVKADPNYQAALNDWSKAGVSGYEDVDVDNIYKPRVDKEGNPILNKNGEQIQDLNGNNFFSKKAFAAGLAYEQREIGTKNTTKVNSHYEWAVDRQDAKDAASAKDVLLATPVVEAKARTKEQVAALNESYYQSLTLNAISAGLPKLPNGQTYKNYTQVNDKVNQLKRLAGRETDPKRRALALQKVGELKQGMKLTHDSWRGNITEAGYTPFGAAYGVKTAVSAQKQMNALTTADARNVYDKKMEFRFKNDKGVDVVYHNIPFYQIYNNPVKYGLSEDSFNIIDPVSKLAKGKRPLKEFYVQNSAMPIMIDDKNWGLNDMLLEFEVNGKSVQGQTSFTELGIKEIE